jgi:hypothetical protein
MCCDHSLSATWALRQPCRAPRLLISGCTRSTSTLPCAATTRHPVAPAAAIYLDYAARLGASARRAARHAARRAARRRLLRLAQARRRLLRLRRASGCLGTSRGSSRGSSCRSLSTTPPRAGSLSTTPSRRLPSTTSPTPRVRVPRHVARLVTRLVVDYSVRRDFVLRPRWLYFRHAVRRDCLSRGNTGPTLSTPRTATTSSSGRIASTIHLD